MNRHFTPLLTTEQREGLAFFSLARTQKRLSWVYRNWAIEAANEGKTASYIKYRDEAKRLWREAKDHIEIARRRLSNG